VKRLFVVLLLPAIALAFGAIVLAFGGEEEWFKIAEKQIEPFCKEHKLKTFRNPVEIVVIQYESPEDLADKTGFPLMNKGLLVVARMGLNTGIMRLGRPGVSDDYYCEFAKYLFYPLGYQWGQDDKSDAKLMEIVERFAAACLKAEKAEVRDGAK
jgi:hypothetical protein